MWMCQPVLWSMTPCWYITPPPSSHRQFSSSSASGSNNNTTMKFIVRILLHHNIIYIIFLCYMQTFVLFDLPRVETNICKSKKCIDLRYLYIAHFIKPYRDPCVFVNWISVRFYEMDCITRFNIFVHNCHLISFNYLGFCNTLH